jgi:Icc-related predicted phosphoesterase
LEQRVVKILAVSDKVMEVVYTPSISQNFGHVDMVIACGDLPPYYLDFIISSLNVPGYFVYGNHDIHFKQTLEGPVPIKPPGWVNLDERGVYAQGLWLAGLEGCLRYRPDGVHQYTQTEMYSKALKLVPRLIANRLKYGRYLDILVAHSPPYGIHDGPDYPHIGFKAFLTLMNRFRPRYLLHGHKHVIGMEPTRTTYGQTEVINVYPYRVIEVKRE